MVVPSQLLEYELPELPPPQPIIIVDKSRQTAKVNATYKFMLEPP
jgi:hypothetical protein